MFKSIGYPQNPSDIWKLKTIANLFVPGSEGNLTVKANIEWLLKHQIKYKDDFYDAANERLASYIPLLLVENPQIEYSILKGKDYKGRPGRGAAACSGLIQAAIEAQSFVYFKNKDDSSLTRKKKPYTDDWTADGFLRWAISIGILDYNELTDKCSLTDLGKKLADTSSESDFKKILGEAFLSYPPVSRILFLLLNTYGVKAGSNNDPLWTKFKLGSEIGFVGEAGFSSIAENIWLAEYNTADAVEKKKVKSNREGTMDKHARMICSWLKQIGWIKSCLQNITGSFGGINYSAEIECYYITVQGYNAYRNSIGQSSHRKIPKNVYLGTLSTKSADAEYLSLRRAVLIDSIKGTKTAKTITEIQNKLSDAGFNENEGTIEDDIKGLVRIGIRIKESSGKYKIEDDIVKLQIRRIINVAPSAVTVTINSLRASLSHIDHKYLCLIDYSVDSDKSRDFEQVTMDLLTNELGFVGTWLGGVSKPDGIISADERGLILDTKAYKDGYDLPRHQKDEMFRYVSDFVFKNATVNPTQWWQSFPAIVSAVNFGFVSSDFKTTVPNGLTDIANRTIQINNGIKINGGAITAKVLLEKADEIKEGSLSHMEFIQLFNSNRVI